MQISITFTCRECGQVNLTRTDTSNYPQELEVRCRCGHVSGIVKLDYRFLEEHRPSWEDEPLMTIPWNSHTITVLQIDTAHDGQPLYNLECQTHPWERRRLTKWHVVRELRRHLQQMEETRPEG